MGDTTASDRQIGCADCRREVEVCAFCDTADCSEVICFRCLRAKVARARPNLDDEGRS